MVVCPGRSGGTNDRTSAFGGGFVAFTGACDACIGEFGAFTDRIDAASDSIVALPDDCFTPSWHDSRTLRRPRHHRGDVVHAPRRVGHTLREVVPHAASRLPRRSGGASHCPGACTSRSRGASLQSGDATRHPECWTRRSGRATRRSGDASRQTGTWPKVPCGIRRGTWRGREAAGRSALRRSTTECPELKEDADPARSSPIRT
jgi:hypothetical protein